MIPVIHGHLAALAANPAILVRVAAQAHVEPRTIATVAQAYADRLSEACQAFDTHPQRVHALVNTAAVHVVMSNIVAVPTMLLPTLLVTERALERVGSACSSRKEQMQNHHRTALCKMGELVEYTFTLAERSTLDRMLDGNFLDDRVPRFLESIPYLEERYCTQGFFFPDCDMDECRALVQKWKTFLEDKSVQRQCRAFQVMHKRVGETAHLESFEYLAFRMEGAVPRDPLNPARVGPRVEQGFNTVRSIVEFLSLEPGCSQPAAFTRPRPALPAFIGGVGLEPTCGDDIAGPASSAAAVALPSAT